MTNTQYLPLMLLTLALLLFPQVALGDAFEDAEAAHRRQDYQTAFRGFKSLAEQGNAKAQSSLGWMYQNALAVLRNDKEVVKWYRKAANQGHASAQWSLGMHTAGIG